MEDKTNKQTNKPNRPQARHCCFNGSNSAVFPRGHTMCCCHERYADTGQTNPGWGGNKLPQILGHQYPSAFSTIRSRLRSKYGRSEIGVACDT
jgi:hypothetical protein